jgi:hypothetical protein
MPAAAACLRGVLVQKLEISRSLPRQGVTHLARIALLAAFFLLCPFATVTLNASQCDQSSAVVVSHLQFVRMSQNTIHQSSRDDHCGALLSQFVASVTARRAAVLCQDGAFRQRALEILDEEIQAANARIPEQSCG